jgi:hypothetical protein
LSREGAKGAITEFRALWCTGCSSHHPGLAFGAPPSTRIQVPVMKLAAGDGKKTTAAAT